MAIAERFDAVAFLNGLFGGERGQAVPADTASPRPASPVEDIRPADLPEDWRELYEERAGIMEYDAKMTRADAEELALRDILRLMGHDKKPGQDA